MIVLPFPSRATRQSENQSSDLPQLPQRVGSLAEFVATCRVVTKQMKYCLEDALVAIEHQLGTMNKAIALVEDSADRKALSANIASLNDQLVSTRRVVGLL